MNADLYSIPLTGLREGVHNFEFICGPAFFKSYSESEAPDAQVRVEAQLTQTASRLQLVMNYRGTLELSCDRCLVSYTKNVLLSESFWISFGDTFVFEDQVVVLPTGTDTLDLAQRLYETIALQVPLRKVPCEETDFETLPCDASVLNALNNVSDTTEEAKDLHYWDSLKKLKNKNKR